MRYGGLAEVPVLTGIVVVEELDQPRHVDVVVVVEVTEPSVTGRRRKKKN